MSNEAKPFVKRPNVETTKILLALRFLSSLAVSIICLLYTSTIGAVPKNKKTIEALGLTKLGKTVELPNNAATQGDVRKVAPYVKRCV